MIHKELILKEEKYQGSIFGDLSIIKLYMIDIPFLIGSNAHYFYFKNQHFCTKP